MKKTFAWAALAVASLALVGCVPQGEPTEDVPTHTALPTVRPLEEATGPNGNGNSQGSNSATSNFGANNALEITKARESLEASAFFLEGNKVDGKYPQWLQYATGPQSSVRVRILPHVSSAESYCLQATSLEDPSMSVLYDSQTKKVVDNGKSCSPVKGASWESLTSETEAPETTQP